MLQNRSVATIDNPEFINITPYNPLISQCEIKVLYLGENRNGSYITKDVAIQMANSLPGTPIVGAWREEKEDFGDHGHVMTIEDGEIKFSCKTRPYGFVAPDAQVWFKKFIDTDEFGNETEREYLMTNGYLWTGQYEEVKKALAEGQPQSMELDEKTLDGHWATNNNSGIDFFIINDALFSKLCILGSDVEPCFEGAAVTDLDVSKNFAKDEEFTRTLFTMINELKDALSNNKGGLSMPDEENAFVEEEQVEPAVEFAAEESETTEEPETPVTFAEEEVEEQEVEPAIDFEQKYNDAMSDFAALQEQLQAMQSELEELRAFKLEIVNKQKDELINRYHMLSDEDKKDVIMHKEEYSLDEIEAKLAILYVQKNVNFDTVDGKVEEVAEEESSPITTFSLDNDGTEPVPAFIEALRRNKNIF